ncbi:MAG: Uncharacterized protein XD80_1792 [Synergistales bacterium 53_16]|jgi:DNA repair exonuclease SbcCD ATPase subunit|nr:MAG: Uncharacterized protein XD80_1792 [Synergistales bacterium 53_16]
MKARERIAYLDGLIDGLKPADEDQRRIYEGIIQAMKALADEIDEQAELIVEQQEFIEEIADWSEQLEADLAELEEGTWYTEGDEEPEDEEEGESFGSATCPECGHLFFFDPDAYEDGDAVECPGCGFCMIWPHDVAETP